jgi:hypothetical protein
VPFRLLVSACVLSSICLASSSAQAKFTTVTYDRNAGALLDALPQGKPFLIEGTVFPFERRVEVFYRRRGDGDCTAGPTSTTCPAGEKSGDWACRSWERTGPPEANKAEKFTVLVPRLLHSLEAYCLRVAFYRTLSLERSTELADNLVVSLDRTLQERSGPDRRELDPEERRRVIDEFFAAGALHKRVTPVSKRGVTFKQANLGKLKTALDARLHTLHVARDMVVRMRRRFEGAAARLLDPKNVAATRAAVDGLASSADPGLQKLLAEKVGKKKKTTLLQEAQAYRDTLGRLQSLPLLEAELRADDGAFLRAKHLSRLCGGIRAIRAGGSTTVKACGPELARIPKALERAWRGLGTAAANRQRVYASVVEAVRRNLTDRLFTETALQDPALVARSKFIEYFFSTDIGVAAAFVPATAGSETVVIPYLAVHFFMGPYNTNVPLRLEDSFLRRFTLFFGLNLKGFEVRSDQLAADGLFGSMVVMTGAGLRLTDFIRLNGGAMLYRYQDQNPLFRDQPGSLAVTGFISASLVLDVYKWAATAIRQP